MDYARLTWGDEKDAPSADALAVLKGGEDEKLGGEGERPPSLARPVGIRFDPSFWIPGRRRDSTDTREPDALSEGWVLSEKGALSWAKDARSDLRGHPAPGSGSQYSVQTGRGEVTGERVAG